MESKVCKRCLSDLPLLDFYKNKNGIKGVNTYCIACSKAASKKSHYDNRDKIIAKQKDYRLKNRDYFNKKNKDWREKTGYGTKYVTDRLKSFKNMNNAELERLAILVEEAAEVQQIAMKIIRHGYSSYNPFDESKMSNRYLLEKELGDLVFALGLLMASGDVSEKRIQDFKWKKKETIGKYLHYNEV